MNDSDYWSALQAMPPRERELFLIKEEADEDKRRMAWLMAEYRWFGELIEQQKRMAENAIADYNVSNSDEDLEQVELYADMVRTYQWYRRQLRQELKEVREHIRWLRTKYKRTLKMPGQQTS